MEIDVKHVAKLARIRLTDEEVTEMEVELRGILDHIENLAKVDVEGAAPTFGSAKSVLKLAEDNPAPGLAREEVLKLAPATKDNGYLVPKEVG